MKIKQYQSYFNPGLQGPVGPGGSLEGYQIFLLEEQRVVFGESGSIQRVRWTKIFPSNEKLYIGKWTSQLKLV